MNQNQTIQTMLDPSGIIIMKFSGNLLSEDMTAFKSSLDIAKITIGHHLKNQGKKVKILLDMQEFSGKYCPEAVEILSEFAKNDAEFVEKTASFGGSDSTRATGEIVAALAHRENIKICTSKEEALAWLSQ